ncbi:MAG: hypothetical protein MJ184_02030 [Treponema sp.]|uniref:hypothetical protein n=1 Tax=Treponema sp. TaxID=166 RepID=UPI00298E8360|nr:hypothetical protein [Treponema sp.]MCQ2600123.1 hypothetical protein [Treponema sp.]
MGVVFFLGFVVFVFFIGTLFLPAGFLLNKKHKVLSVISFVISGILMTPLIATICFYCVMAIGTAVSSIY